MNQISMIGKMVHYHRKRSGLSREALARISGVGKTAIFDIEHGKTTFRVDILYKILDTLNIRLEFESPLMNEYEEARNA